MPRKDEHVTLDGYVVRRTTDGAIGFAKADLPLGREDELQWCPKSLCSDGDRLEVGDTDIEVAEWKAEQEGWDY